MIGFWFGFVRLATPGLKEVSQLTTTWSDRFLPWRREFGVRGSAHANVRNMIMRIPPAAMFGPLYWKKMLTSGVEYSQVFLPLGVLTLFLWARRIH